MSNPIIRVIGTAGHVDHGKSALIEALTGTHPDRLKEEQERQMTIDLGFAWWTLPDGEEVGVVDVPGHRDFIENMLAGVGGIDAVLFVVAADEGVMPQTREHLAIVDLLNVPAGVVALTKVDLVDDPDWLDLVEADLRQVCQGTVLGDAEVVRVSAVSGEGLDKLQEALSRCLSDRPPRADLDRPRLPIDRVFTIAGFGTVVTGTLLDGSLEVGEEVEILPGGQRGRVRGLQTHKQEQQIARPGSRTAVNVSSVAVEKIQRGHVLSRPGLFKPTRRLDLSFRLLSDASQPLEHDDEVKFFLGAAEVLGRVRLLGVEALNPGESGWLQLELRQPVVAARGDRYILRRPSPGETMGGGAVVDPHPAGRHKRFSEETLARLETLAQGEPAEVLLQALLALGAAPLSQVLERSHLDAEVAAQAVEQLLADGKMVVLEGDKTKPKPDALVVGASLFEDLGARAVQALEAFHQANPLRQGMPRQELKSRLKASAPLFAAVLAQLEADGEVGQVGPCVSRRGHAVRFNAQQQAKVDELLAAFATSPNAPPTVKECLAAVGQELYTALVELGELRPLSPEVVFRAADYQRLVGEVRALIETSGPVTVAQVRDQLDTTRRYVLALLEHLDAEGVTVREGDLRRLRSS